MSASATRGRPRQFDEDRVLDEAVDLFWDRGYRATTTRDLERALGITQSSIYNTFGSKRDLLIRAIDRYESRIEDELFVYLLDGEDGYGALRTFFAELGRWVARNEHRGCMVVNLMAAEGNDADILKRVQAYRTKIRDGIAGALTKAADENEARADLLLAAVLGLHVTARTASGPDEVAAMVRGISDQIEAWSG